MARTFRPASTIILFLSLLCLLLGPGFGPARLAEAAGSSAGPAALVKDIDTRTTAILGGSTPSELLSVGGTTYFRAQLDSTGYELWKTDGTAGGTVLIKDIVPGPDSSNPGGFTNVNGTIFFSAGNRQIWKTNGTTAGTTLVAGFNGSSLYSMANVNGTLFFLADNSLGNGARDLWKSDGTAAGTVIVKQFSSIEPTLFNFNGTLFFSAGDSATGTELWKSDGTAAGTVMVKDIAPGPTSSAPTQLTNVNGTLVFLAGSPNYSSNLWKSDGTEVGTVLVDPTSTLRASDMINVNGTLFFSIFQQQEFGGIWGIWKGDGTAAGTTLLKDADHGYASTYPAYGFTNANGTLYFVGRDATNGSELWKSDGTAAGTLMLKDINPGASDAAPSGLTNVNGILFFSATQNYETELWKTDGTAAGTTKVKDIAPGVSSSNPTSLVNANGVLLFSATDWVLGAELWKSDGTEAGTALVKDIDPDAGSAFSQYYITPGLTDVNGALFFTAEADLSHRGLWKSDGTEAGTTLIKNFPSGQAVDTMPTDLTNVNGTLFFVADDGTTGRELWKSDGTAAGTKLVKDINPDAAGYARIAGLTNINGILYFSADDSVHGQELWKSDGTEAGTTLVKDINPGFGDSSPSGITLLDGKLYFAASDGSHGAELWKSDGTEAGTTLVRDMNPGAADGFWYPSLPSITSANGMLFMTVTTADSGEELWRSDGTSAGTMLVKDINPGSASSSPGAYSGSLPVATLNGSLFFAADDGVHGLELWKTDGTTADTTLVKDIVPGAATSYVYPLTTLNGRLLFYVQSPSGQYGLWQTDGTAAGTTLVRAYPQNNLSYLYGTVVPLGNTGKAIFSAYDEQNGVELWQTDGTSAGTQLLQNIAAGPIPSDPDHFTLSGKRMFFLADDYAHGKELWSLPLSAIVPSGTAQITPGAGGTATFANVELSFSPNAVTTPVTITYSGLVTPTQSLGGAHSAGTSFTLEARDGSGSLITHFAKPYTLTISYTDEQLAALGVNEADLNLAFWNGSVWVNVLPCAGCGVDTANNRLTAVLDHFTEFALVGSVATGDGKSRVYLPLVVR